MSNQMKNDLFKCIYCEFAIISDRILPDQITEELGLTPDRCFKKGETSISRHSGSVIIKPYNLWAIHSIVEITESEGISTHIEHIKSRLDNKYEILSRYKNDKKYDLSFLVHIESEDTGVWIDLQSNEIEFINVISNRVSISVLCNRKIEKKVLLHDPY